MTEVKVTIKKEDDGALEVRVEGSCRDGYECEVELGKHLVAVIRKEINKFERAGKKTGTVVDITTRKMKGEAN